ncbi:alpha/beta fold hydrolase [Mucilaginibacter litoreus]|uniref:Alpha/beta fold hydrolase n=1 Tax=Mucilaginibacter litoreus TaxID=1048221 RepID=A0ABW3AWI7_9SPHI
MEKQKTFVLVHGSWQGNFAWEIIKLKLAQSGHEVINIELPGHGAERGFSGNLTMTDYRDSVISQLMRIDGQAILVGHSMGGMVISAVAESIPVKIEKLVFLAAFVPANGDSLLKLAMQDTESLVMKKVVLSEDQSVLRFDQKDLAEIFIQDAKHFADLFITQYQDEPAEPNRTALTLTAERFGAIPKYYIYTLHDNAISINRQQEMAKFAGIKKTYELSSGHTPQLSKPDELTHILLSIAGNY